MFPFRKKKKSTQESISRSVRPTHFNREKPRAIICCMSCNEPLWRIEVRHIKGTVVSTNRQPVGKNSEQMKDDQKDCPICNQPFGKTDDKGQTHYLIRSEISGQSFSV